MNYMVVSAKFCGVTSRKAYHRSRCSCTKWGHPMFFNLDCKTEIPADKVIPLVVNHITPCLSPLLQLLSLTLQLESSPDM